MRKKLFFLLLFSTAMAYAEAMVVVYLRRLVPDVLFLIPVPWVAPVIVPICISSVMIVWGCAILKMIEQREAA